MVFFNYATMQMAAKIVYYGPGLCGKTTNLQYIYQKTSPKSRGEMVSLETETDRTLFFDLLPLDVGNIAGFKTRFQLYTVPGQVFYNNTRKLVLRGVDGIVFVADSQIPMFEANIESYKNLEENVRELGLSLEEIPMVLQYNKRDLKAVVSVEELNQALNPRNLPWYEASALLGDGIFETLKGISKATLITVRKKALGEEKPHVPERAAPRFPQYPKPHTPAPSPPPVPVVEPQAEAAAVSFSEEVQQETVDAIISKVEPEPIPESEPKAASVEPEPVMPTPAEIAHEMVEFSQVTSPGIQPAMKKIEVKSSDVALQLDALRDLYTGKAQPYTTREIRKIKDTTLEALNELVEASRSKERKVTKKLKIRLDPAELEAIKSLSLDFHLAGDTIHKRFSNAMSVNVEGKSNPKKVTIEIKLEILKK
jgi:mutual gliding-motility protein MglA